MSSPQIHRSKNRENSFSSKKIFARLFLLSFLIICFVENATTISAATGINDQISFQGKVVNTDGTNVANGSYDFVFSIYTVSSGGTAVWTETWNSGTSQVTVTDGIFQVSLGTHTDLPGSIDFNTDNIYLGIEFNGDGEMSPRVHFTAAPYAFNAMKVAGLTVTDTTGTLTIPNGETISFGGSFTTSASNDVTLTTSGATNVTLPTTGTLATLAGTEELTNKTIGSTGLTFSGATTDITTTSGESLVLTAAGAGTIDLQDATTADSLTLDNGGLTLQNSETIGNSTDDIITFIGTSGTDNTDLFLDLDGTSPVLYSNTDNRVSVEDYLNVQVSGVTGAAAGDIWYDSAANKFKINESGTTKILCNTTDLGCGSGASDLQTTYGSDADGSNATISLTAADDSLVFTNPASSGTDSAFVLQISQQNTTAAVTILDLVQSSNAANGVNLTANSIDTETGLAITTNALTSGKAVSIESSATALTGSLETISLTGSDVGNTGSLLLITDSGVANATTPLKVTGAGGSSQTVALFENTGTGASFRVNDVTSDASPFVINASGHVGIRDATPDATLDIDYYSTYTTGSIVDVSVPNSVTLTGALTGFNLSLANIIAEDQSLTGTSITFPTLIEDFGSGTYNYQGVVVNGNAITQAIAAGTGTFNGFAVTNANLTQTTGTLTANGLSVTTGTLTTGGTQRGITIAASGVSVGNLLGINISSITAGAGTERAIVIGSGWDTILDTASIDITGAGAITGATGVSTTTVTASSTIAANGGITFDASTDTVGAFTAAGTINLSTNILENIGNSGTDFIATTGALTLAGILTANGGISIGTQNLTGTTGNIDYTNFDVTGSNGNVDIGGTITAGSGNEILTLSTGKIDADALTFGTGGGTATTSSGSGLEVKSDGLTLIQGCNDGQLLEWTDAGGWACADDSVGGGSADLQTAYGNDTDTGNTTISLTSADDSLVFTNPTSGGTDSAFVLQVSQQHTTDAIAILDLIQSSNAANGVNLTANAIDGETGLAITTNGLTSGSALSITSSSTAFTGSLAGITFSGSNAANTGNVFAVSNTGALNTNTSFLVQHDATGTNNLAVRVNDEASDTTPFVIDGAGNVGIGTTTPSRVLDIFQASSVPQLRLSKDLTNYSEFTVDSVGDLQLAATGTDIRALSENLWVCDNDACPALTLTGDGNIFVENVLKFGNGVYLKNDSATELGVYDNDDQVMLIFDEQ